jgi:hypothetical protein
LAHFGRRVKPDFYGCISAGESPAKLVELFVFVNDIIPKSFATRFHRACVADLNGAPGIARLGNR